VLPQWGWDEGRHMAMGALGETGRCMRAGHEPELATGFSPHGFLRILFPLFSLHILVTLPMFFFVPQTRNIPQGWDEEIENDV